MQQTIGKYLLRIATEYMSSVVVVNHIVVWNDTIRPALGQLYVVFVFILVLFLLFDFILIFDLQMANICTHTYRYAQV